MKTITKAIALVLFLFLTHTGMSQHYHYYNVGDTIRGRDSIYHYQWWSEQWLSDTSHALNVEACLYTNRTMPSLNRPGFLLLSGPNSLHGEVLRYCYTEEPLNIIGIASATYVYCLCYPFTPSDDEPIHQDYLRLYDANDMEMVLVGEVPFVNKSPKRYMDLDIRGLTSQLTISFTCCDGPKPARHAIVPIHEYYFDNPVTVKDSFYVGTTNFTRTIRDSVPWDEMLFTSVYSIGSDSIYTAQYSCNSMCENSPEHLYKFRLINDLNLPQDTLEMWNYYESGPYVHDTLWHWQESPQFMLVFPIIEIDSSWRDGPHGYVCPEVTDLRATTPDDAGAVMLWNTRNGQEQWQISYGLEGTPPDSGIISTSHTPACRLRNLDSCTAYDVYVRAICHHDSTEYSQWVGPVTVNICDTTTNQDSTQTESLVRPTALEQYTILMPNPAHDKVQVTSSYNIESVNIFTIDGREVRQFPVGDRYSTIDIKGFSPGAYIVVIHTPAGLVSRKLIVK